MSAKHISLTSCIWVAIAIIITMSVGCCDPQDKIQIIQSSKKPKRPTVLIKDLQVYKVSPWLSDLMSAVVLSNKQNYAADKYFYILTWGISKKHRQLTIMATLWDEANTVDHDGVVQINGMRFLINGDIGQDGAFFKKDPNKKMRVKICKCTEEQLIPLLVEPILQGLIESDPNVPVYVEVYVKSPIKGYEMEYRGKRIDP